MTRARQGKIASLPAVIREGINQRLHDGQLAPEIIKWLHEQPEVLKVLDARWREQPISAENISEWRQGGYQDWLDKNDRVESIKTLSDYSFKLARAAGVSLSEGAAAIAGGRILELLEQVADGEKPTIAMTEDGEQGELPIEFNLEKLVNAVATLGHVEVARQKETRQSEALALDVQRFRRQTAELFLEFYEDKRAREIIESNAAPEVKTESLVTVLFGDRPSDS